MERMEVQVVRTEQMEVEERKAPKMEERKGRLVEEERKHLLPKVELEQSHWHDLPGKTRGYNLLN